jgi:hypothetical protein
MSLLFTDASTNKVDFGSAASLDNLGTATVLMWVYPTSVANALRHVLTKANAGGPNGWALFKTGANGTSWALHRHRATNPQQVILPGVTANEWQLLGWVFNIPAGNPKAFRGTLASIVSEVTNSPVNGAGTQVDDSASDLDLGARDTGSDAAPMRVGWVGIWNRELSLGEIRDQQFRPHVTNGCVLFQAPGYAGTGTQPDWSGNGNAGTVTGATVAPHVPLGPLFGRRQSFEFTLAAGGAGNPWYSYAQQ